jgi:predicted DNA-binding transcriptional regulator AlpA
MSDREHLRRQRQSEIDKATEQVRRNEHRHDEARFNLQDHRVLSLREWAALCGFSTDTARRIIAAGTGPPLTHLSKRRIGITVANHIRWLALGTHGAV